MKKATINIQFDEEKLAAIRMYMGKKDINLDLKLTEQLEKIYEKYVPPEVRDFISERSSEEVTNKQRNVKQPDGK